MTPKRAAILAYIRTSLAERGKAPTTREIGAQFGISFNTAYEHVCELCREGALVRTPHVARGLALADDPRIVAASRLAALATEFSGSGVGAELLAIRQLLIGGRS